MNDESLKLGGIIPPLASQPGGKKSCLVPLVPLLGENGALLDIICPNSVAIWCIVALLYGWSIHNTQLQAGPHSHVWSAGFDPGLLNFMAEKSGGG